MRSREGCRKDGGCRNETHDEFIRRNFIMNGEIQIGGNIYGVFLEILEIVVHGIDVYTSRRHFESLILEIVAIIAVLTRDDRSKNKFLTFDSTALQRADSRPLGL